VNNDSPQKAILVVLAVALFCSVLVSLAAVLLEPLQRENQLVERSRNVVALSGLAPPGEAMDSQQILAIAKQLDTRLVDLETGEFIADSDPQGFDARAASVDPETSLAIPAQLDSARLGRRARYEKIYLVWGKAGLARVILPIRGQGMWSTLYGYVALQADLRTIAAATFYEQAETPGLGDQVTSPAWLAGWTGRELFGPAGEFRFRVASGPVSPDTPAARYQVDGLTGATVTGDAVTAMLAYWFGPHGFAPLLAQLEALPPRRVASLETNQ
jgi:Na+-transporting NADH:ubiquinone oxidoreductase subunit C